MEIIAVSLAIIYLLLAVKQNILCWLAAILSSSIFFFIMYSAGLYMEAYLQIFYILMALYGWSQWRVKELPLFVSPCTVATGQMLYNTLRLTRIGPYGILGFHMILSLFLRFHKSR